MSRGLLRVAWLALLLTTIDCDPKTGEFFLPGATSPQVGNLTGTVSSGTSPISGATVALSGTPTRSTTTSSTGVYDFFDLPIGPLTITTTAALFTCPSQTVTIVLNQTVTSNIACTPLPGSVTGTVRVAGVGQSGIAVTLTQGTATIGTATTGAGGTYTIANVPPGTYSVAVTAPSGADCSPNPKNVTVQSGQATTADFGCVLLPGQISGTVRLSGAPAAGVVVTAKQGTATLGTATTSATGAYLIADLTPGTFTVSVVPPSSSTCTNNPRDVVVQPSQTTTADFDCTLLAGSVSGVVRVSGTGQSGVLVTLTQGTTTIGTATTGTGGTYTIANVPPGTYSAAITAPANTTCIPNPQNVTVVSNQAATANFDCTPQPGSVSGAVRLNGVGQSGVQVTLTQGTTTFQTTTAGSSGLYTFSNIPPGTYTATITTPSGSVCPQNPQTVTVQSNQNATADFDCATDFAVSLTTTYRNISPGVSETCVEITTTPARPGGSWTTTWSGPGIVGASQRTGTLDATGKAFDRQSINLFGTYNVAVGVTSFGLTRTANGSVVVTAAAGTCPPP